MSEVSMKSEDLQKLISAAVTAAVQEVNKPKPKSPQELAEIEQAQQHRKETSESDKMRRANQRNYQENVCTHEHKKAAGGGTHCVHVYDNDHLGDPGYIICQECNGKFRPDSPKWRKLDPTAIFDTAKFNFLFQSCAQAQGEIIG